MPKRASQMRTRSSRVKAERPLLGSGPATQCGSVRPAPAVQALTGAHRPSNRKGHRGHAHYSGSPSPLRSGDPCRPPPRLPSGSCRKAHWRSRAAAAPRGVLASALARLRRTAGERSPLMISAVTMPSLRIMRIGNHVRDVYGIAAAQQESFFWYGGITDRVLHWSY